MGCAPVRSTSRPRPKGAFLAPETCRTVAMSEQEQAEVRLEFARLKQEHADFDAAINAMIAMGCDPLQIQRMKKKKLALKDRLSALEDRIIPDIIA
ncbi:hypothetical protein J2X35_002898 [Mesorhizobium sp. BE184]|nr:hypothetical protein [Mesorhizobium sp. BE184]